MDSNLIFILVVDFVILFTGVLVYFHNRRSASNLLFFLIALTTVLWSLARYFSVSVIPSQILFWIRMDLFFAVPHAVIFYLFIRNFPADEFLLDKRKKIIWFSLLIGGSLLALSPYVFSRLEIEETQVVPIPGILMPLFGLIVFGSIALGIWSAIKKYRASHDPEKTQWRLMLIGITASYLFLIVTNFLFVIFFKNTVFITFGPLFMLPLVIGTGYAILRHQLFNVKIIATEALIFTILAVAFFEVIIARGAPETLLKIGIFGLFFIFGISLMRSVLKEVEQRERMEKLSRELAEANQELRKLDRAKSEFISLASHQLRAPLTIIKGYISLILEGTMGALAEQGKKAMEIVSSSAEQLIKLVNDLLDLSRIEAGKIKYDFRKEDFISLWRKIINEFKPRADAKNVSVTLESIRPIIEFSFDPDKMREVAINLLDNAVKYSPDSGKVTIRIEDAEDVLRVSVRDQGIGIKKEDLGKMFTKFARTEEAQRMDPNGMGIGLYFVKRVIDDHNGKVWVESEGLGKGSIFFVELPIQRKI